MSRKRRVCHPAAVVAPLAQRTLTTGIAAALTLAVGSAAAQATRWSAEVRATTGVTVTDNANLQAASEQRDDVILDVTPSIALRAEGGRLRVAGSFALQGLTYVNGAGDSAIIPAGRLNANLEAIERWFFLEGEVAASRGLANPLGPRPEGASSVNRLSTTNYRITPYVERVLIDDTSLRIASSNAWTRTGGDVAAEDRYTGRHSFLLQREPRPLGWAVEAERDEERVEGPQPAVPTVDLVRARLRYGFDGQFAIGLRGGITRSDIFVGESRSFVGGELLWRPTERTRLEGFYERQPYGGSWLGTFSHRSPFVAWDIRSARSLTSFAQSQVELPATGDLAGLLDAALRTRITDPVERARAVEDFISRRGLPRSLTGPTSVFSDGLLIRTLNVATVAFIGRRNTLALTGFSQRDQSPAGADLVVSVAAPVALRQQGATLLYGLRLTTLTSVSAATTYTKTQDDAGTLSVGTPLTVGADSRQQTYRAQVDCLLSLRTTGFAGVRHQRFTSEGFEGWRENALFAGLAHRF
mgnify:CR=1 FL=1